MRDLDEVIMIASHKIVIISKFTFKRKMCNSFANHATIDINLSPVAL